ncbi:type I-E CRISPR-associated protein Cas7/Cse4/CasC [Actinomyces sp. F1_1611]
MALYVDIHAIHPVGPNNLNRDLNGSPKTAEYGGVRRARVSSQAWKRPMRLAFRDKYSPENLGLRTKQVVKLLVEAIIELDESLSDDALQIALAVFNATKIKLDTPPKDKEDDLSEYTAKYLIFLSTAQIESVAQLAVELFREGGVEAVAKARKELKAKLKSDLSVDLALFGRMVADDQDLNVDASCQVAHALSTHRVGTEFDFFTAVDDAKQDMPEADAGAGMMGTVEFQTATFYRYATVNLTSLAEQLGGAEAAARALGGFVDVFATSMPTGKQNTFAAQTLPAALVVCLRSDRPMSWVGAFERPVYPRGYEGAEYTGYTDESVSRMLKYGGDLDLAFGNGAVVEFGLGLGDLKDKLTQSLGADKVLPSLTELCAAVEDASREQLEDK